MFCHLVRYRSDVAGSTSNRKLLKAASPHSVLKALLPFNGLTSLSLSFQRVVDAAEKFQKAHRWQDNIRVSTHSSFLGPAAARNIPSLPLFFSPSHSHTRTLFKTIAVYPSHAFSCMLFVKPQMQEVFNFKSSMDFVQIEYEQLMLEPLKTNVTA